MGPVVEASVSKGLALPVEPGEVERAVRAVLAAEGVRDAEISVAFLPDPEIARLNRKHLGHTGPTDVISFALHEAGEAPLGDVYVGAEQAARQAGEWGVAPSEELLRLAIHGTLHVLGYDHPKEGDSLDSPMGRRQEELLRLVLGR